MNQKKKRQGKQAQKPGLRQRSGSLRPAVYIVCGELLLLFLILLGMGIFLIKHWREEPAPSADTTKETQEQETETAETEEEAVVYEKPSYDFHVEEVTVEIEGLSREYTLAWVSDLHMITDREAGDVDQPYLFEVQERYEELPVTAEGIHASELWPEIVKFLNYQQFDGIIFGGDMIDYCSSSNMEKLKEGYEQLRAPVLYIRADHDYGTWYGGYGFREEKARKLHEELDGDNSEEKYLEFDDFIIVGVDNSNKNMPAGQMWMLEELYNKKKPVIAVTHVPYGSRVDASLEKQSLKVRNKIYYWGGGEYVPDEYTKEYLHMIYREDTFVKQVLAGHLHASWDGMLTNQVPEHIFGPAFAGNIGVIHVKPQ